MNWFKYRLPGNSESFSGASHNLVDGFVSGFVIAPFCHPADGLKTIPCDFIPLATDLKPEITSIPPSSLINDYFHEVKTIISLLADYGGKVVAARAIRIDCNIDLNATFSALCISYPDAFVFMFSTPEYGTWIGASPELLLKVDGDKICTMALAGTKRYDDQTPWDKKNCDEQALVVSFIKNCLHKHFANVTCEQTYTLKAGSVKHLCTPIHTLLGDAVTNPADTPFMEKILCELSPTPALCGSDRNFSYRIIGTLEHFNREMYGGFCGPNSIYGTTAFFVNLRSAKCSPSAVAVFVGGGITSFSIPEDEWHETEIKSNTIISKLQMK